MENKHTPKPESDEYNVEQTQDLNVPKYNSATDKRAGGELPAIENMNNQDEQVKPENSNRSNMPDADLGNDRDEDEDDAEKIIRR